MNIRQRKKLMKKIKILLNEIIEEISDLYNFTKLLNKISDHFLDGWNWSKVHISFTDFKNVYGSFPDMNIDEIAARYMNIDEIAARYMCEHDIIEFNLSALGYIEGIYKNRPGMALAIIADIFIHEYCHKLLHAVDKDNIIDKKNLTSHSNQENEHFEQMGLHNSRFYFIYTESTKILESHLEELGYCLEYTKVIKVRSKYEYNIPTLKFE